MRRPTAILAAVLLATSVAAKDGPRWFTDVGGETVRAKWGIPETDAVGFEVVCLERGQLGMRPALFAIEEPAAVPQIRFSVDGEAFDRPAKLDFSERDQAFQASAIIPRDDALIDALRRGRELTYDFDPPLREGDAFTLSLSGSAKAIDAALDKC